MSNYQSAKQVVLDYYKAFDTADANNLTQVITEHVTPDYHWRGMHPFYEQHGATAVVDVFWAPLRRSLKPLQRRLD